MRGYSQTTSLRRCIPNASPSDRSIVQRVRYWRNDDSSGIGPCAGGNAGASCWQTSMKIRSTFVERVHRMPRHAGIAGIPARVFRATVARHHADVCAEVRLPRDRRAAGAGSLDRQRQRTDHEDHVVARDREVVHQRGKRPLHGLVPHDAAVCVGHVERDFAGECARREVREEQHLAGDGVDLRMRGHVAGQLLIEGPPADGVERHRIDLDRPVSFFEREQFAAVPDDVRVRDAVGANARDLRIDVARVARRAEQRAPGGAFERPLSRPHPAVAVGHAAVRDVKRVDHAVGLQRVVATARRELRIRTDPVQRRRSDPGESRRARRGRRGRTPCGSARSHPAGAGYRSETDVPSRCAPVDQRRDATSEKIERAVLYRFSGSAARTVMLAPTTGAGGWEAVGSRRRLNIGTSNHGHEPAEAPRHIDTDHSGADGRRAGQCARDRRQQRRWPRLVADRDVRCRRDARGAEVAARRHQPSVQRELFLPRAAGRPMRLAKRHGVADLRRTTASSRSIPAVFRRGARVGRSMPELADLLSEFAPPVVSFHFGLPSADLVDRVKAWGATVLSSATTVDEARWLEDHGADVVIAQGVEAGGHRGMFLSSDITTQIGHLRVAAADRAGGKSTGRRRRRHRRRKRCCGGARARCGGRAGRQRLSVVPRGNHERVAPRGAQERSGTTHRAHQRVHRSAGTRHRQSHHSRARTDVDVAFRRSRWRVRRWRRSARRPKRKAAATLRRYGAGRIRRAAAKFPRRSLTARVGRRRGRCRIASR